MAFERVLIPCCLLAIMVAPAAARTRPRYGGTLRVEVEGDPLKRDRLHRPEGIAWRLILDGLTHTDTAGNGDAQDTVRPSLAVRWTSENDDHRWQFWLRPGVSFQNGKPLNSPAVVASLEESCRATACPWTSLHFAGQSIVFLSDAPMPNLPAVLAESEFLIKQITEGEVGAGPVYVGTGPFQMKSSKNNTLRLEAYDECWQGRPFVDAIEIYTHRPSRDTLRSELRDPSADANSGSASDKADVEELAPTDIRQARQQQLNVVSSPPLTLLALEVRNTSLAPQLRNALALAVDRAALYQVIFQKQGEVTASLLPASLSGYSFLFPTERDLNRAQALRGGITPPPLTLAADGNGALQLAAERLALNWHDAGFPVKVIPPAASMDVTLRADIVLRELPLYGGSTAAALGWMLRSVNPNIQTNSAATIPTNEPVAAYRAEHDFLERHNVIPLLYLPRAWAIGGRVRDLRLNADGVPDLANVSLQDAL